MITSHLKSLGLLAMIWLVSACSQPNEVIALSGNTMGTTYNIKLNAHDGLLEAKALQAEIDLALEQVNDQMSTYRKTSELSQFNQLANGEAVQVSSDTIKVITEGKRLHELTSGALDITLGPLVNIWGFGPDKKPLTLPTDDAIAAVRVKTGMDGFSIQVSEGQASLLKKKDGLYIDLSAIAKGFGVDKIASLLDQHKVSGYLVEIGGELRIKGTKTDKSPWRIAIEQPTTDGREIQQVITPGTMGLATSGDYRNYFEDEGQRFSHLIDPRSGKPIKHTLASVTVLHPECMTADGLATAMMVLGTQASLALAKEQNLAIMLIEKQQQGFQVFYSEAFKAYVN
ncbi:FAD:protein FMN transferase [Shewanella sp. SR44-3]|uniref:FAD:protein FMN transferase n=1 Tax=unclassified Shewanella TaxID=196818 RepID=UPI0015FC938A|nr:FAD:protein FMN transferase [Shewanella sp. SR44-3]MBB1270051.1 FAD:protein FMN transferase [Shewanella sp. SR44-3]